MKGLGFEPLTPESLLYQLQAKLVHQTGNIEAMVQAKDLKTVRLSLGGHGSGFYKTALELGTGGINELGVLRGGASRPSDLQEAKGYGVQR